MCIMSTALLAGSGGCSDKPAPSPAKLSPNPTQPVVVGAELAIPRPHAPSYDGGVVEFVNVTMNDLFPIFCVYRSMPLGEKAALWGRQYAGKWVRWTGKLRSFTQNGITLQMRPEALTFDVSLWIDAQPQQLEKIYKRGEFIEFTGQLSSYDDVFQKLYLTHGAIHAHAAEPNGWRD